MHDFNFFELYGTKGRQQGASDFPFLKIILVLLAVLAAWPLFNLGYGAWLKYEEASLRNEVTSNEKYSLLKVANEETDTVAQMAVQTKALEILDQALKGSEWLDEPFFFALMSTVPKDVKFDAVSIFPNRTFIIDGTAANKASIAALENNIRETDRFDALYVKSITNEGGTYSFEMKFQLKGGAG